VPLVHSEASGCSALHGGGRTWLVSWAVSWQTPRGGCQGRLSSGREIVQDETLSPSHPLSASSYFSAAIPGQALLFQVLQVWSEGGAHHNDLFLFSCCLFYSRM